MDASLLDTIREAWSWIGLDPAEVVDVNAFGNLIVRATDGAIWRICPEELSCDAIALNAETYAEKSRTDEFRVDWEFAHMVELARETLGPVSEGRCYCLKFPAVIGGKYEAANLGTISLQELIACSGDMAEQIKDVPDGGQVRVIITGSRSHPG